MRRIPISATGASLQWRWRLDDTGVRSYTIMPSHPRPSTPGEKTLMPRLGLAIAFAVLLADQLSKLWLLELLDQHAGEITLLPFFNLVMVWNKGISFGLFGAADLGPWPFVVLSGAIVAGLVIWLWRIDQRLLSLAVGAVIGGAVGNMVDRIRFGAVADFFDLHILGYHWPAFNIADSAIVIGVGAIVLDAIWHRHERQQ